MNADTLKIYRRTVTVMALLIWSLAIPGLSTGQSTIQDSGRGTTQINRCNSRRP